MATKHLSMLVPSEGLLLNLHTNFDSGEISGWLQSLARDCQPSMWWPRWIVLYFWLSAMKCSPSLPLYGLLRALTSWSLTALRPAAWRRWWSPGGCTACWPQCPFPGTRSAGAGTSPAEPVQGAPLWQGTRTARTLASFCTPSFQYFYYCPYAGLFLYVNTYHHLGMITITPHALGLASFCATHPHIIT